MSWGVYEITSSEGGVRLINGIAHTTCHGIISLWVNFKRTRPNYAVHQMKSSLVDACHLAERSIASMVLQVSFDLTFTGWDFRYPVMNQFNMA